MTADQNGRATPGWPLEATVDLRKEVIAAKIQVWDSDVDDFAAGADEQLDLDSTSGDSDVDLTINLNPCSVSGDIFFPNPCGSELISRDATLTDRAGEISYTVQVVPPVTVGNLRLRCSHFPLWPDEDDPVTFTATAVDSNLNPVPVDELEIWIEDRDGPDSRKVGGAPTLTAGPVAPNGDQIRYGCWAKRGDQPVFTGWRLVQAGNTGLPPPAAVPVLYNEQPVGRIDIVFVPDVSYPSPSDPVFLLDVRNLIENGYFGQDIFLERQHLFNFWIYQGSAFADDASDGDCEHQAPIVSFADAHALVHRRPTQRDCAPAGEPWFSVPGPSAPIQNNAQLNYYRVQHETGHRPFGLADEYCCDGGYFENPPANVYDDDTTCSREAADLGNPILCRRIVDNRVWGTTALWFVSDPGGDATSNDLMDDRGTHTPGPADRRRIKAVLDLCEAANCEPSSPLREVP